MHIAANETDLTARQVTVVHSVAGAHRERVNRHCAEVELEKRMSRSADCTADIRPRRDVRENS